MTKEKMISKVQKLKAKAENAESIGSIAEAEIFAAKMRELMERHELSMSEIEFKREVDEPIQQEFVNWETHGYKNTKRRTAWIERLAAVVTNSHGCRYLVHTNSNRISIIGHESNVALAEYTLATLVRAADIISVKEYDAYWYRLKQETGSSQGARGYRSSWLKGFVDCIIRRMAELKQAQDAGCTALIRIDTKLAKVQEHMDTNLDLRKASIVRGSKGGHARGYNDGNEFANGMDIKGRAVKGTQRSNAGAIQ